MRLFFTLLGVVLFSVKSFAQDSICDPQRILSQGDFGGKVLLLGDASHGHVEKEYLLSMLISAGLQQNLRPIVLLEEMAFFDRLAFKDTAIDHSKLCYWNHMNSAFEATLKKSFRDTFLFTGIDIGCWQNVMENAEVLIGDYPALVQTIFSFNQALNAGETDKRLIKRIKRDWDKQYKSITKPTIEQEVLNVQFDYAYVTFINSSEKRYNKRTKFREQCMFRLSKIYIDRYLNDSTFVIVNAHNLHVLPYYSFDVSGKTLGFRLAESYKDECIFFLSTYHEGEISAACPSDSSESGFVECEVKIPPLPWKGNMGNCKYQFEAMEEGFYPVGYLSAVFQKNRHLAHLDFFNLNEYPSWFVIISDVHPVGVIK